MKGRAAAEIVRSGEADPARLDPASMAAVREGLLARMTLLTVEDIAEVLRISVKTAHNRVAAGTWPVVREGRRNLVRASDLLAYIDRHTVGPD